LETVLAALFTTQIKAPSKARPTGREPAGKVPRVAPVVAFGLVTLLLNAFVTQMLAPS
jgi:hypothetical protein